MRKRKLPDDDWICHNFPPALAVEPAATPPNQMNMTMLLFGGATTAPELPNSHPEISGLRLTNSNPEAGELAVRMTAGRIDALVAERPGPSFWICQRKGREQ